jgi:hypothetical protein
MYNIVSASFFSSPFWHINGECPINKDFPAKKGKEEVSFKKRIQIDPFLKT